MRPALLLIDLQNDYLSAEDLQPSAGWLISGAAKLLAGCRAAKIPVIHVWTTVHRQPDRRMSHWKEQNRWRCVAGTAGHCPPAILKPLANEPVIHKTGFNAFTNPELSKVLRKLKCDALILGGLHLHACVRAAAMEGLGLGWPVFIAEEAVASDDPVHAAATRRWLTARCVKFESVEAVLMRVGGRTPGSSVHRSPRQTKKILFKLPVTGPKQIAAATAGARRSWETWRQTKFPQRRRVLEAFARQLENAAPTLATQMASEIGKPVTQGLEEIQRAVKNIRDVIRRAGQFEFQKNEAAGTVRHPPVGVVALISPWNNPVAIPAGKIAPALAYGNVVIWKPAPAATKISEAMMSLWRKCGAPAGLVRLLPGDQQTAQALAADENIDAVTLTAGAQAGFAIQEICARRQVPLQGELSGNNAAIVWHDADLHRAAEQIVQGAFGFAGQRCTANRRVIVPGKICDDFLRLLKAVAEKLSWGDPVHEGTVIGPVIHKRKRDEHDALIRSVQKSGARVEFPFASTAAKQAGAYAQPAIVVCDDATHPIVQEETMSPLLVVQRARDFAHALKLCNGVRHGLVAALFSQSAARQKEFLTKAQAGMLKLNSSTAGADVSLPFGGWKSSGIGPPEHGESDALFYTRTQAIYG